MINSITVCGRTLLETVEHLLDHAERPQTSPKYSTTVSHGEHSISITSEPLDHHKPNTKISDMSKCNVGFVTEEVVETMIVGEAPYNPTIETNEDGDAVGDQTTRQAIARKRSRFVILDLRDYRGLGYRVSASSYGRIVMNLLGNAMKFTENGFVHISVRSEDLTEESGTIVLKIEDSGLGISTQFLQHAFEPFRKQNQHTAGTGVGLSVVKRILEDIGGQIDVTSVATKGTEVLVRLPLQRLPEEEGHDPKINPLPVAIEGLQGRKACILYQAPGRNDTPEQVSHQQTMKRYVTVLSETLSDVLKLDVYHSSVWDGSDETEVVICPEVSFESLQRVRTNAAKSGRRCPAIILVAMDILEAETLRTDARVKSGESIVESVTQPCGPYKLSIAIKACLFLYDCEGSPLSPSISTTNLSSGSWSSPQNPAIFGPRFGLSDPSLPIRAKSRPCIEEMIAPFVQDQSPPSPSQHEVDNNKKLHIEQALIVDDNAINRRLLAAWMKKHKVLFKEAKDGQQALDMYQESDGKFDTVLMDISMPVMDGMTATRYIREFEKEKELKSSHIIALTGLTSASAKFEAWTSGVDDFLTKPVDFKRLEKLMEAGRGGEGTGFMKEHGSIP
jgi:CheY-like chemotaxis protein